MKFSIIEADKLGVLIGQPVLRNATVKKVTFDNENSKIIFERALDGEIVTTELPMLLRDNPAENKLRFDPVCLHAEQPAPAMSLAEKLDFLEKKFEIKLEWSNETELTQMADLLLEFTEVFTKGQTLASDKLKKVSITTHGPPIARNQNIVPEKYRDLIDGEIEKMLKDGVICECPDSKGWKTPLIVVEKSNGDPRPCLNFKRTLNLRLKDEEVFEQRPADDLFNSFKPDAKYFSSMDLLKSYWQVPLTEDTMHKTAFQWRNRVFMFKVLPFGLKTSGNYFCRAICEALERAHFDRESTLTYLDDICVQNGDFGQFLRAHKLIFTALQQYGLRLSGKKCQFLREEINFLGRVINSKGIHADPKNISGILAMKPPKSKTELRSLIGVLCWLRSFIGGRMGERVSLNSFSDIMVPIFECNREKSFRWSEKAEQAFQKIKSKLMRAPFLSFFDPTKPLVLTTDASNFSIGAVLMQQHSPTDFRVISCQSKTLTKCQMRWSATEKEAWALKWAIERLQYYLRGRPFVVMTDHRSLVYLDTTQFANIKISRWQSFLANFDFTIQYLEGKSNCFADWLSRGSGTVKLDKIDPKKLKPKGRFLSLTSTDKNGRTVHSGIRVYVPSWVSEKDNIMRASNNKLELISVSEDLQVNYCDIAASRFPDHRLLGPCAFFSRKTVPESRLFDHLEVAQKQQEDPFYFKIIEALKIPTKTVSERVTTVLKAVSENDHRSAHFTKIARDLFLDCGTDLLCVNTPKSPPKIVVPEPLIAPYLHNSHDAHGHVGIPRVTSYLRNYFWPSKFVDIDNYVKSCEFCARKKGTSGQPRVIAGNNKKGLKPFDIIYVDFVTMPVSRGYRYILTLIDSFSRFMRAYPLKSCSASDTSKCLVNFVSEFRVIPSCLSSDRGTHFNAETLRLTLAQLGIKQRLHVPWRPQSSGVLERAHRSMKDAIFITCKQRACEWPDTLNWVISCLNSQFNKSTGRVPFECIYGRKAVLGLPTLEKSFDSIGAHERNITATLHNIHRYVRFANRDFDEKYRLKMNNGPLRKSIEKGETVCLYRPVSAQKDGKFSWIGRFTVLETNFSVCLVLDQSTGKTSWVHCAHVRPLVPRDPKLVDTDWPDDPVVVKITKSAMPESQGGVAERKADPGTSAAQKVRRTRQKRQTVSTEPVRRSSRQTRQTTSSMSNRPKAKATPVMRACWVRPVPL